MTGKEVFATSLAVLASTFNRQMAPAAIEGYWIALKDLGEEEFAAATAHTLKACKFMPTPAELLTFVRPPRDLVVEAATAWRAVRDAVDSIDYTVSVIDFGPHVNAVIRQLGGWDALCRAELTGLDVWKRKEFERLYLAFAEKPIGDIGDALLGAKEARNYPARTVKIAGIPSQPVPMLEPIGANGHGRELIETLADAKSLEP